MTPEPNSSEESSSAAPAARSGALGVLSGHTLIYLLGSLSAKLASFLLLPIFTPLLSREDYGVLELTDATLSLLLQIVGLKLDTAMTRHYFDRPEGRSRLRVVSTAFLSLCTLSLIAGAALYFSAGWLADVLPGQDTTSLKEALRVVSVILVAMLVSELPIAVLKAERRSVSAVLWQLLRLGLELAAKITLVVVFAQGVLGVLLGQAFAAVLFLVGFTIWILRRFGTGFDPPLFREMVRYSAPMIVAGICGFLLHSADRFMMPYLSDFGQLGLYGIGYKFGAAMTSLVLGPFLFIWYPYIFSLKDAEQRREIISSAALHTTTILVALSLPVALLAPEIIRLLTDEKFHNAWIYIPLILFSYLFWGLFQMVQTPFYVHKRTADLPKVVGGAALVNVLMNFLLVPPLGAMGAALATGIAFVFLTITARLFANRLEVVPIDWRRIGSLASICLITGIVVHLVPLGWWGSLPLRILTMVGCLTYLGTGFLRPDERAHVFALVRSLRRRSGSTP